jgi:predicted DNA-binding protein with PD1-like motif
LKSSEGRVGRVFILRLENGNIIPECIARFAETKKVLIIKVMRCNRDVTKGKHQ